MEEDVSLEDQTFQLFSGNWYLWFVGGELLKLGKSYSVGLPEKPSHSDKTI